MPRQSGTIFAIIIVPIALLLLAVAIFTYRSADELRESRLMVNGTNKVLEETQELLILAQSAETAQRGFVLTGDDRYLAPFREAEANIPATVQSLAGLLSAAPGQAARLKLLNGYLQLKLSELNETIETRRAKGFEAARAVVLNNTGQAATNSIRNLVGDMTLAEQTLLEQRLGEYRTAEHRTLLVTAALFAGLLLLSIGGGYVFLRSFDRLRRAENELEEKAKLLQATLDTVAEGIAAFDGSLRLVASNRRFFDIFGLASPDREKPTFLPELIDLDLEKDGSLAAIAAMPAMDDAAASGIFERKDGRTLDVAKNLMASGGAVYTARDITERLTAEAALLQAQKMETVGQLTGGLAHDFNNLLQIIMANLDLALRHSTDETVHKRLKEAIIGAERGSKLTRQLLAFARRQPLKPEPVDLVRLVRELTDLLRRTLGESIEIEETAASGLWEAMVDRSQLENAIVNLAINARDAMPDGGRLTIESGNAILDDDYARTHDGIRPGQYVMIAVTDTGTGMSREIMNRAFDPFFSTKAEGKGTGLGLSMVYGFARQSGGHAKIYSEVGIGTTIKLYLPRSMQGEQAQAMAAPEATFGHGETILVVEDEKDVRSAVLLILQDLGYRTVEAANGQAALDVLRSGEPLDLMFTDVVMPGEIQGRFLAQEAVAIRPGLPIVFTSGYTENSIVHHGRLDDGVHLLSKPYRKEDLARKLRTVLGDPAQRAARTLEPLAPSTAENATPGTTTPLQADRLRESAFKEGQGRNVVFVEDDPLVQMATVDMLEALGHVVSATGHPNEAIGFLSGGKADALIVDVNLGQGDGRQLAQDARTLIPDLKVVFATGRDPGDLQTLVPGCLVLDKPYGLPELRRLFATLFPE